MDTLHYNFGNALFLEETWVLFIRHQMEETGLKQGGITWTCLINPHFCLPLHALMSTTHIWDMEVGCGFGLWCTPP